MGIHEDIGITYVHPTFLYESIADFIIFVILIKMSKNQKYSGQITFWYLILYSFIRFFIEGLRTDSLMFFGLRTAQIISLIGIIIGVVIIFMANKNSKKSLYN